MTTLRPVGDHLIVAPLETNETSGGLVLPGAATDDVAGDRLDMIRKWNKLCLARVLAVGPGRPTRVPVHDDEGNVVEYEYLAEREPIDVEPGQLVAYERAGGVRVPWGDDEAIAIRAGHVMFAVEGDVEQILGGLRSAGVTVAELPGGSE